MLVAKVLLFATFLILKCAHSVSSTDPATSALRAASFILSKRDPDRMTWKAKEAGAAVLALTAQNPLWRSGGFDVKATKNGVRIALLDLIARGEGYSAIDHSLLVQFLGVLRVLCDDASNFHGHDLLAEASRRMEEGIPAASPANAALVLALCVYGVEVDDSHLFKLLMPRIESRRACDHLCVERAALNLQALTCLHRDEEAGYDKVRLERLFRTNTRFLSDVARDDGNPNLVGNSLAIQAHRESPYVFTLDESTSVANLIAFQKPDGSFGGSVAITALVLPALAEFSAADLKDLECIPKQKAAKSGGLVLINYEIIDDFTESQSLVGDLFAPAGGSLLAALRHYESEYPEVLRIVVNESVFGASLHSINGIKNDPDKRVSWKVYGGGKAKTQQDLEKIFYADGDSFELKYEQE